MSQDDYFPSHGPDCERCKLALAARRFPVGAEAAPDLHDMVKEPPHYRSVNPVRIVVERGSDDTESSVTIPAGKLEALHVIEAFGLGWHAGNVVKYILRAGRKGDAVAQDLRKAENIIGRLIAFVEGAK